MALSNIHLGVTKRIYMKNERGRLFESGCLKTRKWQKSIKIKVPGSIQRKVIAQDQLVDRDAEGR